MVATAHAGAIERMLEADELAPETARTILTWHFAESDQSRLSQLSAKARRATLSPDEARELDWYLMLGDFLSILQSRARIALGKHS
jgi:hypothetical protein